MDRECPANSSRKNPIRSFFERSGESHCKGSAQYATKRCISATSSAMFVPKAPNAADCSLVILLENVEFTPFLCFKGPDGTFCEGLSLVCDVQVYLDLTRNPNVVEKDKIYAEMINALEFIFHI